MAILNISAHDLQKDVERLMRSLKSDVTQVDASYSRTPFPKLTMTTTHGPATVTLLGTDAARVQMSSVLIYGVGYEVDLHIRRKQDAWGLLEWYDGLRRLDGSRMQDTRKARASFDSRIVPQIARQLDAPECAALLRTAGRLRIASDIESTLYDLRRVDALLERLNDFRNTKLAFIDGKKAALVALGCDSPAAKD